MNTISKKTLVAAFSLSILALLPNCGGCGKKQVVVKEERPVVRVDANTLADKVDNAATTVKDKVKDAASAVKDTGRKVGDAISEKATEWKHDMQEGAQATKNDAQRAAARANDKL